MVANWTSMSTTLRPKSRENPVPKLLVDIHLENGARQYGVTPFQAAVAADLHRLRYGELNVNVKLGVLFLETVGSACRELLAAVAFHNALLAEWRHEVNVLHKEPMAFALQNLDTPQYMGMALAKGDMAMHLEQNSAAMAVSYVLLLYKGELTRCPSYHIACTHTPCDGWNNTCCPYHACPILPVAVSPPPA